MMKIYTLMEKVNGTGSVLNGKLLFIYVAPNKCNGRWDEFRIVDAENIEDILMEGAADHIIPQIYGTTIIIDGNKYEFEEVAQLVPSAEEPLRIMYRHCSNCGDNHNIYYREDCIFTRSITKEEFLGVLEKTRRMIAAKEDRIEEFGDYYGNILPYSEIDGHGDRWIYTLVVPLNIINVPVHILSEIHWGEYTVYIAAETTTPLRTQEQRKDIDYEDLYSTKQDA